MAKLFITDAERIDVPTAKNHCTSFILEFLI